MNPVENQDLGKAALAYAGWSYPVFPLQPRGKKPATARGFKDATTDQVQISDWWRRNPDANIGVPSGPESGFFALDVDGPDGEASLRELIERHENLPKTRVSITGKGRHLWFRYPGFRVGNIQNGKLGKGLDIRGDGGYVVVPPSWHASGRRYEWEGGEEAEIAEAPSWFLGLLREGDRRLQSSLAAPLGTAQAKIPRGERHQALMSYAGKLRHEGADEFVILAALLSFNETQCDPPKARKEVEKIAHDVARYPTGAPVSRSRRIAVGRAFPWPEQLRPEALHGIAGEIVRAIDPHTEADPAAVLIQLLAGFGSIIGRGSYWTAEADRHHLNLFAVLVGDTAKGRKGTSWGQIKRILDLVDPDWAGKRIVSGLASGEGLIHHVRDPRSESKPIREKGIVAGYEEVQTDAGVADKRLFVIETEFSRVLKICDRESNILSDVVRLAWDGNKLQTLTKQTPDIATEAHITLVGHITQDELLKLLTTTQSANGFGNRFLWACVRRSKLLPEGGSFEQVDIESFASRLRGAVEFARNVGELKRDREACAIWKDVYGALSEGGRGLFGSLTSRAEAQVMRLAAIHAVLDCSLAIRSEHLNAGLAAWEYCEDSARYLFGNASGDPVADRIRDAVNRAPEGLTRDQLRKLFSGHVKAEQIDAALKLLSDEGTIVIEKHETGGRPAEVIRAA
jgi:hypothetical protein